MSTVPNAMQEHQVLKIRAISLLVISLGLAACGAPYAESPLLGRESQIRSSEDVDNIIVIVETYANALEGMQLDAILPMVSAEYYENAGTTDTTMDDYGFNGIFPLLEMLSEHVLEMRVELEIKDIIVDGDRADVLCDFGLTMLYGVGESQRWQTERDVNRLQLRREANGWMIISGL
jgi:hypothetical protein